MKLNVKTFGLMALAATAFTVFSAPVSAHAATVEKGVLKPMSAWLVGPSKPLREDANEKFEPEERGCSMINEYENGMIIGLHARKEGVVGMTVDVRREAYSVGQRYNTALGLGQDSYRLLAEANTPSTLSLDLKPAGKVAQRLTGLGTFRLQIDRISQHFSTAGFTEGLKRLQDCMGGVLTKPVPVAGTQAARAALENGGEAPTDEETQVATEMFETAPQPADAAVPVAATVGVDNDGTATPVAMALPMMVPTGYRYVLQGVNPSQKISWKAGPDWREVLTKALAPHNMVMAVEGNVVRIRSSSVDALIKSGDAEKVESKQDAAVETWTAAKGQTLSEVLADWGGREGVNIDFEAPNDPVFTRDIVIKGSFEEAMKQALLETAGEGEKAPVAIYQSPVVPDGAPAPKKEDQQKAEKQSPEKQAAAKPQEWRGLEGAELRDVLKDWGKRANVDIMWMMDQSFELKKSVKYKGSFEEAVAQVLGQYEDDKIHPKAQLNRDPDENRTTLIVRISGL